MANQISKEIADLRAEAVITNELLEFQSVQLERQDELLRKLCEAQGIELDPDEQLGSGDQDWNREDEGEGK